MPTSEQPVMQILGADAWLRWDLWASRAWDAAEKAVKIAAESDLTVNLDPGIDTRILTLFHADEVASRFAAMVNPLFAVSGLECAEDGGTDDGSHVEMDILIADGDDE